MPIHVKMKNIEETKRAKQLFEKTHRYRGGHHHHHNENDSTAEASVVVGSFTANYSHHSKEYAIKMRNREMSRQKEFSVQNGKDPTPAAPTVPKPDENRVSILAKGEETATASGAPHPHRQRVTDASSDDKFYERFKKRTRRF